MMFGHDDQKNQDDNQAVLTPAPDAVLTPAETNTPTAMPPAPQDSDAAGDFIMTDAPKTATPTLDTTVVPAPPAIDTIGASTPVTSNDDLLQIKQEAMQQLSPLLDHLDQAPEDKFRTTMMMIQAADNDKLIPVAYEAAKAIADEKVRAQALLDIVNEINYFTQSGNTPS